MELLEFQERASSQIAERFSAYAINPLMVDRSTTIPFFQSLVAITGSGKTLILADSIAQIRDALPLAPIVLWISKGRVVVSQTYENLSVGKYASNVSGFTVCPLQDVKPEQLADNKESLLLIATVGKFALEDTDSQDRKIFRSQLDSANDSLWEQLKKRRTSAGLRRPLIIVYDEGHNLSDLQTERLLELAPDGIIVASATMSVPPKLNNVMARLRNDRGWLESDFATAVSSRDVVDSGLVKERISIDGYVTPMETALDNMLSDLKKATSVAKTLGLHFGLKAIYVCSTNAVDGQSISEDIKRTFGERQARPILIWRHLVEVAKIAPEKIAVYCQLKFSKECPKPATMHLFDGGEKDYGKFLSGNYDHIIFNLGLQEGWDDPLCAFAYIDKEMASTRQITQVIGRVLRQPGAEHYNDPMLNTAHFHIRTDEKGVFDDIINEIRSELVAEHPSIALLVKDEKTRKTKDRIEPSPPKTVPTVGIESSKALKPIGDIVKGIMDFRSDHQNTVGQGSRMQVLQEIGAGGVTSYEWTEVEHSNRITARSVFRREIQRSYPGGLRRAGGPINLVDIEEPKFDAMIELTSPAADHMRKKAAEVVQSYIQHSVIYQNDVDNAYSVGPIAIDPTDCEIFNKALHTQYSGLNDFEKRIAHALDRSHRPWVRNPVNSGYSLPLLHEGRAYWPDFLVWVDKSVVVIDTKGDHLLIEASASKLFEIEGAQKNKKIILKLISEGQSTISAGTLLRQSKSGYTVWDWRNGRPNPIHCGDEKSAVDTALTLS